MGGDILEQVGQPEQVQGLYAGGKLVSSSHTLWFAHLASPSLSSSANALSRGLINITTAFLRNNNKQQQPTGEAEQRVGTVLQPPFCFGEIHEVAHGDWGGFELKRELKEVASYLGEQGFLQRDGENNSDNDDDDDNDTGVFGSTRGGGALWHDFEQEEEEMFARRKELAGKEGQDQDGDGEAFLHKEWDGAVFHWDGVDTQMLDLVLTEFQPNSVVLVVLRPQTVLDTIEKHPATKAAIATALAILVPGPGYVDLLTDAILEINPDSETEVVALAPYLPGISESRDMFRDDDPVFLVVGAHADWNDLATRTPLDIAALVSAIRQEQSSPRAAVGIFSGPLSEEGMRALGILADERENKTLRPENGSESVESTHKDDNNKDDDNDDDNVFDPADPFEARLRDSPQIRVLTNMMLATAFVEGRFFDNCSLRQWLLDFAGPSCPLIYRYGKFSVADNPMLMQLERNLLDIVVDVHSGTPDYAHGLGLGLAGGPAVLLRNNTEDTLDMIETWGLHIFAHDATADESGGWMRTAREITSNRANLATWVSDNIERAKLMTPNMHAFALMLALQSLTTTG